MGDGEALWNILAGRAENSAEVRDAAAREHDHGASRLRPGGLLRSRRSTTGLPAYHGKHQTKAAPTTQPVIALSSGESEFYAVVLGTATALGKKNMANICGNEVKVALGQTQCQDVG